MIRARCSCGQLSLELHGEPRVNALCHCSDCKRRTGSAFGWSAYFPERQVGAQSGTAVKRSVPVSEPQFRYFCPDCGTTLWWTAAMAPGMVGVAGGAFDPGVLGEPAASHSDGQKCAWLGLPQSWTRYP
ncbi:MAG: GFA family protein [Proteobacteria bacterium]|nr:GFA family protein [Pseudomonadota bacterium]